MEEFDPNELLNEKSIERDLLDEVQHVLQFSEKRDLEILQLFGLGSSVASIKNARFERSFENHYFNLDQIKRLSVNFRLRFVPIKYYSGEIPFELIFAIKKFEHAHSDEDISYFILAPIKFFLNSDKFSTPYIFASTGDGQYELICKWGDKIPFYIPIIRYPYRNFKCMIISAIIFGCFVALIFSLAGYLNYDSVFKSILMKVPIIVLASGMFSTFALCFGLVTRTDFSNENWNARINNKT
jgi:hypothetical protein